MCRARSCRRSWLRTLAVRLFSLARAFNRRARRLESSLRKKMSPDLLSLLLKALASHRPGNSPQHLRNET
jgi:hypothetical protein